MPSTRPITTHPATAGFQTGVRDYQAGRPGYPPDVHDWLSGDLALGPARTVIEVGAGTGRFTRLLRETGARVIAVEPVPAMLERLKATVPDVEYLAASAEALPLADGVADAIVCAQSFHWFATSSALDEFHRVLRPGGRLGLIWNHRDSRVPWVAAVDQLVNAHEGDTPRHRTGQWRQLFPGRRFGALATRQSRQLHTGPAQDVIVRRALSTSFIALLPRAQRERLTADLAAIIASDPELAGRDPVSVPYRVDMHVAQRLDSPSNND